MTTETHGDHEAHKHSGVQSTGHAHAAMVVKLVVALAAARLLF